MKTQNIALATTLFLSASAAHANVSANFGFASDYYRGIFQAQSSASAGIDYEQEGSFVGTWQLISKTVSKSTGLRNKENRTNNVGRAPNG